MKRNLKKLARKNAEQKKYLKEKVINSMSNRKDMIIYLIVGLIKNNSYKNESILFLSRLEVQEEKLTLKLIFQIMQQNFILKM